MFVRLMLVAAIAAAIFTTIACQNLVQGAVEKATGVRIETSGDGVTLTGKDGEQVSVGTGRLDPALQDFPVPSGFTLDQQASGSITSKEGRLASATWRGTAPVDQVANYYKEQLPNRGYREQFTATQGTVSQSTWEATNRSLILNISREGNNTVISAVMTVQN